MTLVQVPVCSCPVRDMEQVLPVRPGPGASGLHLMPALPLPPYIATIAAQHVIVIPAEYKPQPHLALHLCIDIIFIVAHFEIKFYI